MKTVFVTIVGSLVVVLVLFLLISEDQWKTGSGSLTISWGKSFESRRWNPPSSLAPAQIPIRIYSVKQHDC
jgi:hypothetical protein